MLTLLTNAHLHDPTDQGIRHLLVAGGSIESIFEQQPALGTLEVERIDLDGRRVIPGLIDPHVHLTGGGGEAGPATRVPRLLLEQLTASGITCAVGVLGTDDLTRTPAALLATARGLCDQGLDTWCFTGGYHLPPVTITGSVRSDIVHIDRMLGVGEVALSDHRSSQPSLQQLLEIAAEAHVAGLMTNKAGIVHLHLGDGARGLQLVREALDCSELPPRTFHPTHVNRRRALFEEALALAERGCSIDLTAFPEEGVASQLDAAGSEDELTASAALLAFLESDIDPTRVTMSSDGGGCLPRFDQDQRVSGFEVGNPGALFECLATLIGSGVALERILPAFTSNTADLLRLSGKGRLLPGCDADLVVLDQEDGVLGPSDVMIGGRWHRRCNRQVVLDVFS